MKRLTLIIALVIMTTGCAHSSRTITKFYGKTKGINPYGDGQITIYRESYWGTEALVKKMMNEVPTKVTINVVEKPDNN